MLICKIWTHSEPWEDEQMHEKMDKVKENIKKSLDYLMMQGADLFAKNLFGQNALYYAACSYGSLQLEWLLNKGNGRFWICEYDDFGNTCLHGRQHKVSDDENIIIPDCNNVGILLTFGGNLNHLSKSGGRAAEMPCSEPLDHHCWGYQDFKRKSLFLQDGKLQGSNRSKFLKWVDELKGMAQEEILDGITLQDLIFENRSKICEIISHEKFLSLYKNNGENFTNTYLELGIFLNAKVKQAMNRNKMMKKVTEILDILTKNPLLEPDTYRKIMKYLPDWQLRFLCAYDYEKFFCNIYNADHLFSACRIVFLEKN